MNRLHYLKSALVGGASVLTLAQPAVAKEFNIPDGDLATALNSYIQQSGVQLIYMDDAVRGHRSRGAKGDYTETAALTQILRGTGFTAQTMPSNAIDIVPEEKPERVAQAAPRRPAAAPVPQQTVVETIVVTAERKKEDIQQVPIAVTALSQKQLTERQIAGGPDLIKEVPNLTFSKTNFTGYNIEIRGIGTQAISVTTDPAVAVALNGTPFIRNHFFEQEFYDVDNLEVLRGPQGTLWGRNATAGVVNVISAKPTDQYEAMLSADFGNYSNRRFEGMVNLPIAGDKLELRLAAEWTKRDGYSFDTLTNSPIDGRDLWSGRASLRWRPNSDLEVNLVWEHFQEDDDRMRTSKQLCKTDVPPTAVPNAQGVLIPVPAGALSIYNAFTMNADYLSQGCKMSSLYSPDAFQVPYGFMLPYAIALGIPGDANQFVNPYANKVQSTNLRVIESALSPHYKAKNDTIELNADYKLTPALTFTSSTGYNQDFLWSAEDYNRFNTSPGIFAAHCGGTCYGYTEGEGQEDIRHAIGPNGVFCDPQVGCSNRLVAEDLSNEHAWQLSQEFRLASDFSGPLNFSLGGNFLHYETEENYYVFINSLTLVSVDAGDGNSGFAAVPNPLYVPGVSDNHECLQTYSGAHGYQNANNPVLGGGQLSSTCIYIDPNLLGSLNNKGHNYFLSQNPYVLNSYAAFGEAYYNITDELKLTGGLRWTEDRKHFIDIPSEVLTRGYGYPVTAIVDQQWDKLTGRSALNWTPKLDFTDQTLVYASYARGYKAGGANPPGAVLDSGQIQLSASEIAEPVHPLTFRPEFVDAYELGTKNTLLDGALTLNGDVFYYNYKDYQISEIVDRTSINLNFNATVKGAELEASWEPAPGLKFGFAGGYEDATLNNGDKAIDLMDRTAGMPGWMVVKPFATDTSNCILPTYVVAALLQESVSRDPGGGAPIQGAAYACNEAYIEHLDPATLYPYQANPSGTGGIGYHGSPYTSFPIPAGYPGFDPLSAPNNGEGFAKNLGGNQLPNAPHYTVSLTADYTMPVSSNWAATLHGDFYWQADSFARVFNDKPYDQIHGYTNLNLALILTSADGWQVMGYVKNVFNTTAITGDFLNSDDSGLTTNVFLTDPRLYGVRITKDFAAGEPGDYGVMQFVSDLFSHKEGTRPTLWIELGGQAEHITGQGEVFAPPFLAANPTSSVFWKGTSPLKAQEPPLFSFGEEAKVSFQPEGSDWIFAAAVRLGRSSNFKEVDHQTNGVHYPLYISGAPVHKYANTAANFADTRSHHKETHTILDFSAGKDVGLGIFGLDGASVLSGGVRFAQFTSDASFGIRARPNIQFKYTPSAAAPAFLKLPYFHNYYATGQAKRSFHGVGPSLSWNASAPFAGNLHGGEAAFDWGINAGVLFGKQKARVRHHETANFGTAGALLNSLYTEAYNHPSASHPTFGHDTDRAVTVPNLGGFAGVSYRVENAKISLGYRADVFFGAMDGGIDKRKSENLGFFGPFAKISIGFGG